jgi:hypothetical protein
MAGETSISTILAWSAALWSVERAIEQRRETVRRAATGGLGRSPAVNHSSTVPHYGPAHGRNANPRREGIA